MPLLRDFRVLDLSTGLAGAYATKLLVDAGAEVVKVEPPGGDDLRRWSASHTDLDGTDGPLSQFLDAGKRSVVAHGPRDASVRQLIVGADLLVESGVDDEELAEVRAAHAGLDIVSLTPYGRRGPWRDRPWTEFTLQALAGSTGGRGSPDRPPVHAGGRLGEWIGGTYAAAVALALRTAARRRGQGGEHADLSLLECMCVAMSLYTPLTEALSGTRPRGRTVEIPSVERTADGWVGLCTITGQMFQDFLCLIERPDLLDDPGILDPRRRQERFAEFQKAVEAWTTTRTSARIEEIAAALRIPVSPLGTPSTVTGNAHFAARGVFTTNPSGGFLQPKRPYLVDGVRGSGPGPAPALGEADGAIRWSPRPNGRAESDGSPLTDLRVVDLTGFWAGPACTQLLAGLGADVIKVESVQRPDGMRFTSTRGPDTDCWWEWGAVFQGANAGKRGITLDLAGHQGQAVLHRLLADADVLVENYSPRVLDNFGLTWERLRAAHPRLTLVRMPAFGLDGPWRERTGFAQTMEQATGLSWLTGHPETAPLVLKGPCDPTAGLHAAVALLAALERADERGHGVLVEVPMVESALNVAAEIVIEYSAHGAELVRAGNHGPVGAPQNLYSCRGSDAWLALAVADDEQWAALRAVLGDPDWARDAALDSAEGRRRAHDELDARIARFTAHRDARELADQLTAAGVPAALVVAPADALGNPQFEARSFPETLRHPLLGTLTVPGLPFRLASREAPWFVRPAPTLGQHNDEVLGGLAGLTPAELAELRCRGVIGERPAHLPGGETS